MWWDVHPNSPFCGHFGSLYVKFKSLIGPLQDNLMALARIHHSRYARAAVAVHVKLWSEHEQL